jgi:hypothetical protein
VDAPALLGVPNDRRDGRQRFTFTRLHFGDLPVGKSKRTPQLHIEHHQAQHTRRHRCGNGDNFLQISGLAAENLQLVVVKLGELLAALIDRVDM